MVMDDQQLWLDLGYCRTIENMDRINVVRSGSKVFQTGANSLSLAMGGPASVRPLLTGPKNGLFMGFLGRGTVLDDTTKIPAIRMLVPPLAPLNGQGGLPEPTKQFIQQSVQAVLKQHYTDLPP
jgi:hypothetical protein